MVKAIVVAFIFVICYIVPSNAEGWGPGKCWWEGSDMHCIPGWRWNREHRHEEEGQERNRRWEWCQHHPDKCW